MKLSELIAYLIQFDLENNKDYNVVGGDLYLKLENEKAASHFINFSHVRKEHDAQYKARIYRESSSKD